MTIDDIAPPELDALLRYLEGAASGPDGMLLNNGALILLGRVLKDHPKLGVRIAYREAGFDVEFYDVEPILRETAPVLRHALLAALNRLIDEWLRR